MTGRIPTPRTRHRTSSVIAAVGAVIVAVVTTCAGSAAADPATTPGWLPADPGPLTSEQKTWLTPVDGHPGFSAIQCAAHPDFGDCAAHGGADDSKGFTSYIYDSTGKLAGVSATAPATIDADHKGLLNRDNVLDCAIANHKIPVCDKPDGWAQSKPMQYDANGRFQRLTQGATVTPTAGDVTKNVDWNKLNPVAVATKELDNWFAQACESVGKFAGDLLTLSMSWWLRTGSIDVTSGLAITGSHAVQTVVMMIIALGIIGSAITMVLTRRPGPAAELGMGAIKFVLIASLSTTILAGAMHAGDDFARQVTADGADQFGPQMQQMLGIATLHNPGGVLLLGIVAAVLSGIQWLFGFIRQAGIVVLYAMLIFAAAGQLSSWGRQWFPRICSMLIALVLYKPAAAIMYSLGWKLMGTERSLSAVMVGLMVIALTMLALPVMLKFFAFISPAISGGGSAGTALAGIAGGAGLAGQLGADVLSSFGASGGDGQSNYMDATGPQSSTTGPEPDPSPGNSPGSGGGGGGAADVGGGSDVADLGGSDVGAESTDAAGGISGDTGIPVSGGPDGDGAAATGVGGGEMGSVAAESGGNPYVAGAMLARDAVGSAGDSITGMAQAMADGMTDTTDDTGPGLR
ncbi:hypothetical protein [Williamsia sp. CHRR-6]|uniref:hypothetical protein n=1 Tax=Williamsia sp. CHRR-6 TaxID=2835871 RepID=UPI001BDB4AC9|nr:hypothetical protein [Williamsia sp. CHRR-6]MBT0568619.1 hypothetical protein [Williamsia sp. CHRR-6]